MKPNRSRTHSPISIAKRVVGYLLAVPLTFLFSYILLTNGFDVKMAFGLLLCLVYLTADLLILFKKT